MDQGFCIAKIYDAGTSSSLWDEAMDALTQFTGSKAGILMSTDMHLGGKWKSIKQSEIWRKVTDEEQHRIATELWKYDHDTWDKVAQSPCHIIHDCSDAADIETFNHRPDLVFYRDNLGVSKSLLSKLCGAPSWMELCALQFDLQHRQVPEHSQMAFASVVPHIAKATEMNRSFAVLESSYKAVLAALDHVQIGTCILNRSGEVIVFNTEAERILSDKDALWLSPDYKLMSGDKQKIAELEQSVGELINTREGKGLKTETLLSFESQSNKKAILAEIIPLADSLNELEANFEGVLVYLIDSANTAPIKIERAAIACGLSEAESEVCELLAHGWTNRHIADHRNVTVETIKSHIAHVFNKTGVKNRSELIRLILKLSPPVG